MTSIFISYKSEYRSFAEKLYHHLDEWGFNPWLDVFKIPPGEDWGKAIHKGLRASDVVVALMTPEALESEMVMAEWHWALVNNR
ncbi:MAG TPA: toll/interleukin-1 receptor domain-containing protein, partial [Methylotenera sp.]|nr:toll/interleukin-1 receptor domain-containing protein [Methylotenera sp.]